MRSRLPVVIGIILIVGVIHFIAGLGGNGAVIVASGACLGFLPIAIWKLRGETEDSSLDFYLPAFAGLIGVTAGALLRLTSHPTEQIAAVTPSILSVFDIWAVVFGSVTGALALGFRLRNLRPQCHGCRRKLSRDSMVCPRCDGFVCPTCWNPEAYRCKDCERIRTPLLELENDAWWTQRLGRREPVGRCIRCRKDAQTSDLRRCKQCPRASCRSCWDMENGRCIGCNWVMEDLPDALSIIMEREAEAQDPRASPTSDERRL